MKTEVFRFNIFLFFNFQFELQQTFCKTGAPQMCHPFSDIRLHMCHPFSDIRLRVCVFIPQDASRRLGKGVNKKIFKCKSLYETTGICVSKI
jgi:hypothetical protein